MDKNRERFETWLRTTRGYKMCMKRGKPMSMRTNVLGAYIDFRVNDRWNAWNAALIDQHTKETE